VVKVHVPAGATPPYMTEEEATGVVSSAGIAAGHSPPYPLISPAVPDNRMNESQGRVIART
jgi:hypothetical protein